MEVGESPANSFERQASGDVDVIEHILAVIVIDELVAKRLPEDNPGNRGEKKTHGQDEPAVVPTSVFPRQGISLRSFVHLISEDAIMGGREARIKFFAPDPSGSRD
jgi:hypothetical protein